MKMTNDTFNNMMHYVYMILFGLIAICEICNLANHTRMVNKINTISDKVGIECNVKTNDFILTTMTLRK